MDEQRKITYARASLITEGEPTLGEYMSVDGQQVGFLKKARFGAGYFLRVDGLKWQNAPGARYPIERDARTDFTFCKTKKEAERKLLRELDRKQRHD